MFFPEDHPRTRRQAAAGVAEQVMAQLEHPANLDRFDDPAYRLITVILMRCGLRVTDALRLRSDCVATDADGAPYLRYFNHKMHRDALVPIDERTRERHRRTSGSATPTAGRPAHRILFPRPTKNIDGTPPDQLTRPTGWRCSAGWTPATSATNTAGRCISRRTSGVTPSLSVLARSA